MRRMRRWFALFLAAEAVLYAAFLALDLGGNYRISAGLKYLSLLLCLAAALCSAARGGDRLVAAALCLTAVADAILLLWNAHYALGIAVFLAVQSVYLLRLRRETGRWLAAVRLALALLLPGALAALGLFTPVNVLAAVYFSFLLSNLIHTLASRAPWRRGFGIGLFLFLCCDLCVGIFNSPGLAPDPVWQFARIGMWLFYLPSQVLIVRSGFPKGDET